MTQDQRPAPKPRNDKPFFYERLNCYYEGLTSEGHKDGAWSFIVYADETRGVDSSGVIKKIAQSSGFLPRCSHPLIAKFQAVGHLLEWLTQNGKFDHPHIVCKGSDLLVTRHMSKLRDVQPSRDYQNLWRECLKLAAPFFDLKFVWVNHLELRECRTLAEAALEDGVASRV